VVLCRLIFQFGNSNLASRTSSEQNDDEYGCERTSSHGCSTAVLMSTITFFGAMDHKPI